ncbi:MAG: SPOR domain-containing protein [Candidatus Omnitrophota bacterium]
MNKPNNSQLELFLGTGDPAAPVKRQEQNRALLFLRDHEKSILVIIGFLTTATLAYCIGIERGKKTARVYQTTFIDVASKPQDARPVKEEVGAVSSVKPAFVNDPVLKTNPTLDTYTIQVATFQTKKHAERAAVSLKSRGHSPIILSRGKYSIVCVGNFHNKEKARSLLSELKKTYRDCYIRRL